MYCFCIILGQSSGFFVKGERQSRTFFRAFDSVPERRMYVVQVVWIGGRRSFRSLTFPSRSSRPPPGRARSAPSLSYVPNCLPEKNSVDIESSSVYKICCKASEGIHCSFDLTRPGSAPMSLLHEFSPGPLESVRSESQCTWS